MIVLAFAEPYGAAARDLRVREITFDDLPARIASRFRRESFPELVRSINRETARRERDGEFDHLIAYVLQSNQFTGERSLEPALSAKSFAQTGEIPEAVRIRLEQFLRALSNPGRNPRLLYFAQLLPSRDRNLRFLSGEYCRTMRFLYRKEFLSQDRLYESRGHSTDTQVAGNYAVWNALAVLKATAPGTRIERVLIIGPGLDFAPRTDLVDAVPPQSFQPYLTADAVLTLGLSGLQDLDLECVDINDRPIRFINSFPSGPRLLYLYSEPGTQEYNRYFDAIGAGIGTAATGPNRIHLPARFLTRTISVDGAVARAVHAEAMNVITQRLGRTYDLVIATNVLLYFSSLELPLALTNIAAMLRPGGYFIHNDLRAETEADAEQLKLNAVQARSVLIARGERAPLYDAFALHQRR
ncbi:MAG: class I SAM-dependent methyltransferase [Acidobacteriaceae bacterium]|nr:class I SAM-dependent methyltransferase [Acidobacteriaceae bacterium]